MHSNSIGAITFLLVVCMALPAAELCDANLVVLLDSSGSMIENFQRTRVRKLDAAKVALRSVLGGLPRSTNVGLLVFSTDPAANDWIYPLSECDAQSLHKALNDTIACGRTPLGRYMKIAADALLQQRARQWGYGTYRLLILTDGIADDPALVEQYTSEILARGIMLEVIGVDMRSNHILAVRAHTYRAANDGPELNAALKEVLAEVPSNGPGVCSPDDFKLLAGVPDDLARQALSALCERRDQAIGEKIEPTRAEASAATEDLAVPTPSAAASHVGKELALAAAFLFLFLAIIVPFIRKMDSAA